MNMISQKGYAKINLHLDVTGIMANGFHSVVTVMQTVSLFDTVTIDIRNDTKINISCNLSDVPTGEKNIAFRAASKFMAATNKTFGLDIYIEKQIPMAAGLAGGSADAAAVLTGLNKLFGNILSTSELCRIGGALGSDIPFCVVGGTAYAEGKGDILYPFPTLPDCTIVVACGGEGVSTPIAYSMLDHAYNKFENYAPRSTDALKKASENQNITEVAKSIFNIFEQPILSVRPIAVSLKQTMLDNGAINAMMSGSGPSVFGIFTDEVYADNTCRAIEKLGIKPHLCKPIFF